MLYKTEADFLNGEPSFAEKEFRVPSAKRFNNQFHIFEILAFLQRGHSLLEPECRCKHEIDTVLPVRVCVHGRHVSPGQFPDTLRRPSRSLANCVRIYLASAWPAPSLSLLLALWLTWLLFSCPTPVADFPLTASISVPPLLPTPLVHYRSVLVTWGSACPA